LEFIEQRKENAEISMFFGILIRMFFKDTDKHHTPIFMLIIKDRSEHFQYPMETFLLVSCRQINTNLLLHGSKSIRRTFWRIGSLQFPGKKPFAIKGLDQ